MEPVVDQLGRDGYVVQKVDIDQNGQLAAKFGVQAVPTFIVVERGVEVDRVTGSTTIERLKMKLRQKSGDEQPRESFREKLKSRGNAKSKPSEKPKAERQPSPAWRYENPVGHRAAVVRIYCKDTERVSSIGSGTLVRWGAKRIVVLTANHVIKDAKSIIVELFNKKTYRAKVLKFDATWDCAVLELTGLPAGVECVNLELGDPAMQQEGNRLESCGYGPDGKLAANSGLFLGYKRSTATPNGPDDWFEISGHARQGDSGGGVFNAKGNLVGVLWGTDGKVVVGVQAGRIHVLLDSAIEQRAYWPLNRAATVDPSHYTALQFMQRNPTPAKPLMPIEDLPAYNSGGGTCGPNGCPLPGPAAETIDETAASKKPLLPWRGDTQARDDSQDARIEALIRLGEQKAREPAAQPPERGVVVEVGPPAKKEPSPVGVVLCLLAAVVAGFVFFYGVQKK
jgi:hypothetical protein